MSDTGSDTKTFSMTLKFRNEGLLLMLQAGVAGGLKVQLGVVAQAKRSVIKLAFFPNFQSSLQKPRSVSHFIRRYTLFQPLLLLSRNLLSSSQGDVLET